MNKTDLKILESLHPCADGLAWAKTQDSLCGAYDNCERADWMIWLLDRTENLTQDQAVEIAIVCAKHVCRDPEWNEWADRWLSGEDRTAESAASAAYWASESAESEASAAYWAERSTASAESAAYCAASASDAASEARAEERRWQAGRIREIVSNPWGKK
jgi:hypothetical protein